MKLPIKLYSELKRKLTPQAILVLGFSFAILIGAVLLSLPFASSNASLPFVDSLFTAASATCVTGLIVVDTGSFFSIYGQIIILVLIQIGGLGIMSFSILFLFYLRGRLGIGSREIIEETLSTFSNIDVASLLKSVFIFTFTIESIGAVLLTIRFMIDMPFDQALFTGIFHSISAFCNAGFSTFSDSLKGYRTDIFVNIVMMLLIISGGLGFIVLYEIMLRSKKGFSFKKLSLHSRTVIFFSFALIVIGAALIFIIEYDVSMKDYSLSSKFLTSLFQSVTARTAGFNTIDIHSFSMPTIFVIVTLMFIGASPASCGGGIKTSTFAVLIAFIRTRIYNTRNVNLFYNTLPIRVVSKAVVIIVFGVISVVVFSFLISIIEMENTSFSQNGTHFIQIFFEVVSAFGTVGLSTGITSDLGTMSRILITLLMLIGRVGPLTIAVAIGSKESEDIKYAEDNILIG